MIIFSASLHREVAGEVRLGDNLHHYLFSERGADGHMSLSYLACGKTEGDYILASQLDDIDCPECRQKLNEALKVMLGSSPLLEKMLGGVV